MSRVEKREIAEQLHELTKSEFWPVIEWFEREFFERKRSDMVTTGFLMPNPSGMQYPPIKKDAGQFAMDISKAQGGVECLQEMVTFRNTILNIIKSDDEDFNKGSE